jgi:hypothetical protein
MPPEFFGQEIQVTTTGDVRVPAVFKLADREYIVSEIVQEWQDHGFGPTAVGRRNRWWQRRHRNYYLEIYYDRGTNLNHPELRKWVLHRQL